MMTAIARAEMDRSGWSLRSTSPSFMQLCRWTTSAAVQENEQTTEFSAAATLRDVERVPGCAG